MLFLKKYDFIKTSILNRYFRDLKRIFIFFINKNNIFLRNMPWFPKTQKVLQKSPLVDKVQTI